MTFRVGSINVSLVNCSLLCHYNIGYGLVGYWLVGILTPTMVGGILTSPFVCRLLRDLVLAKVAMAAVPQIRYIFL